MSILHPIKALAGHIRENFVEMYTMALITIGVPLVAYVYVDWRLALAVFIATQAGFGIFRLKGN